MAKGRLREGDVRGVVVMVLLVCGGAAAAQTDPGMTRMAAPAPANPAAQADESAMKTMMAAMAAPYTGNADQDFVSHMVPHHQGAIDMAEVELKYGSDPKLKQMAARIIADQQREIAFMQAWAARHKKTVPDETPIEFK
jgi:uncharacterized protein (DUF305 family)